MIHMRHKAEEKQNRVIYTACVLFVLVLISTRFVGGLSARFRLGGYEGDSARIAAFVFAVRDKDESRYVDLGRIQKPGDSQTYTFTVSNQTGEAVSEVAKKYKFTVQLNGSMPLNCAIFKGDQTILSAKIAEDTQALPVVKTAEAGTLPAFTGQTDQYTLRAWWPETENDVKYASRSAVAELLLTVTAE